MGFPLRQVSYPCQKVQPFSLVTLSDDSPPRYVLAFPCDAVTFRYILTRHAHRHDTIHGRLGQNDSQCRPQFSRDSVLPMFSRHTLHIGANAAVNATQCYGLGNAGDSLQRGATCAIGGVDGYRIKAASIARNHPSGFGSAEFREHRPYGYVVGVGYRKGRFGG